MIPGTARAQDLSSLARVKTGRCGYSFWKSNLRVVFWTTLLVDVVLIGVVLIAIRANPQWLIDQRFAIFSRPLASTSVFNRSPEELRADGFLSDPMELKASRRPELLQKVSYLADLPNSFDSWTTLKRAQWLADKMGHDGGRGFPGGTILVEKLNQMPRGVGLCSDHVEGFIALCSIFGIEAREISTSVHTTAGVYLPEEHRWIWIDPEYALVCRDSTGRLMTSCEMRDAVLREEDFLLEYFGSDPTRVMARINPRQHEFYNAPGDFGDLVLTYGNNVFEFDGYRAGTTWMPRPIRQFALLMLGIQPDYRFVNDKQSPRAQQVLALRGQSYAIGLPLVLGTIAYPLFLFGSRVRLRAGASRVAVSAVN